MNLSASRREHKPNCDIAFDNRIILIYFDYSFSKFKFQYINISNL